MAVYEYEHETESCNLGKVFLVEHSIKDEAMTRCPECGGAVRRLISRAFVSTPKTNADLKNMGFTKLVRRDQGVYENVTATGTEHRYMEAGKPETMPDLKRKIGD
ncbi:zinc ribbon domain-containing protein [Candidatus Sumerlaeota bacterium]|nr:zinc ribbon domain-containing protein [Candidatus Sumerlaeota bacterium]